MIYLDNGATTLKKPATVAQAVYQVLSSNAYANPSRGAYPAAIKAHEVVYHCRQLLKTLFNVPDESLIAFTNNATAALNFAIKGLLQPGDHVISTVFEHNSVLRPLYQMAKQGVTHTLIGLTPQTGALAVAQLEQAVQPNTKMLVCTHASNVTGYRLPIATLSAFCRRHHLLFVLDTSQTAGNTPLDMQAQGIDVLCFTGHKSLYGPQGTGGICFRKPLPIEPVLSGGSGVDSFNHQQPAFLPEALEAGTLNVPGIAGLAAGVQYCLDQGVAQLGQQAVQLADQFATAMAALPMIKLYSHLAQDHVGTVALNVGTANAAEISDLLAERGIATRPGAHCAPKIHETLQTVEQGIVRFSFSSFNTQAETQAAIQTMQGIVALAKE